MAGETICVFDVSHMWRFVEGGGRCICSHVDYEDVVVSNERQNSKEGLEYEAEKVRD